MSEQLQEKIIALVAQFAKENQDIHITWFGGEPLLAKEIIYYMSERLLEICQQADVKYVAGIITNGYLLDEETVLMLKKYNVESVQVTLDGIPEIHNKKRKLKDNRDESTFDTIIENITCAKKHELQISIRVNVDRETEKDLERLLDIMIEKNLGKELYLGRIQGNTDGSKSFLGNCLADNHEESDNTRAGGWVKWTTTPIWGTASDYTKNIKNVKMGNIVLKTALMELPLAVALSAIAAPLGIAVSIGTGFISITKSIYSAANLDPKKMWYNERINKYKNSNNATQYRTQWVKSDGTPVKSGKYQYGYCTIG